MSGNELQLVLSGTYLTTYTVCIFYRHVKEITLARSLVVSAGSLKQVSEVVELMAQFLHFLPTFCASPFVWLGWRLRSCSEQVAVRLLTACDDGYHAVNVCVKPASFICGVRISLQQVARALYGLVRVGVVKRECPCRVGELQGGVGKVTCGIYEVIVASCLLTLTECQRYRYVTAGVETRTPERVAQLHRCERYWRDGVLCL